MDIEIIYFNANGKPSNDKVKSGDVIIWLHHPEIDFVTLLETSNNGPQFKILNQSDDLLTEAWNRITIKFPECVNTKRHWWFTCPEEMKLKLH